MPTVHSVSRDANGFGITVGENCLIDGYSTAGSAAQAGGLRVGQVIVGLEGAPIANKDAMLDKLAGLVGVVKFNVAEGAEWAMLSDMGFSDWQCRFALTKADTFEAAMMILMEQPDDAISAGAAPSSLDGATQPMGRSSSAEILDAAQLHRNASQEAEAEVEAERARQASLQSELQATQQQINQLARSTSGLDRLLALPSPPGRLDSPSESLLDSSWVDAASAAGGGTLGKTAAWEQNELVYRGEFQPYFEELFNKFSVLGAAGGMRTQDVRKYVNLLFRKAGLAEFDRHFMAAGSVPAELTQDEFLDFVFRDSLIPSAKEMEELGDKLRDVPNWPLAKFRVLRDTRMRSSPSPDGGVVLGLLKAGLDQEEITACDLKLERYKDR